MIQEKLVQASSSRRTKVLDVIPSIVRPTQWKNSRSNINTDQEQTALNCDLNRTPCPTKYKETFKQPSSKAGTRLRQSERGCRRDKTILIRRDVATSCYEHLQTWRKCMIVAPMGKRRIVRRAGMKRSASSIDSSSWQYTTYCSLVSPGKRTRFGDSLDSGT